MASNIFPCEGSSCERRTGKGDVLSRDDQSIDHLLAQGVHEERGNPLSPKLGMDPDLMNPNYGLLLCSRSVQVIIQQIEAMLERLCARHPDDSLVKNIEICPSLRRRFTFIGLHESQFLVDNVLYL
jgi:hypothetical protein